MSNIFSPCDVFILALKETLHALACFHDYSAALFKFIKRWPMPDPSSLAITASAMASTSGVNG